MVFSGIVEGQGEVVGIKPMVEGKPRDGIIIKIRSAKACEDAYIGCSIAVEGVCLTVTELEGDVFTLGITPETLMKTNLGDLSEGSKVNVERALAADARNSGHVVQGHVDGTGVVEEKWKDGESIRVRIRAFPEVLPAYIVPKGFIAMDGVSLTVCEVCPKTCTFTIMLVPHTQSVITLPHKPIGARVNLEVDCMAKYAAAAPTQALAPVSSYQLMGLAFTSAVLGGLIAVSLVLALAKK